LVAHRVSAKILRDFRKEQIRPHRVTGARHATGSDNIYGSTRHYPAFGEQWRDRYQHRSWVTAGIGHDYPSRNALAHQFGESVRSPGMTAVYPSPWPEIRGEVDYACAGRPRVADPGRGSTMRQRSEDDFRLVERCVFSGNVGDLVGADARALAPLLVRRRESELQPGMLGD